ncbi:hypothetical protein ANO11243_087920 [Dothideomycetidae sp. 11243]|nr:hypothetical protein ANO11243_087920 [fungal sp. No.11243]
MARLPGAWLVTPNQVQRYSFDVDSMLAGQPKVRELWDEAGDCFVHLFPQSSSKGPSFRLDSAIFASSAPLTKKVFGRLYSVSDVPEYSQSKGVSRQFSFDVDGNSGNSIGDRQNEVHLYLEVPLNGTATPATSKKSQETPISEDAEMMVDMRNLFGFLTGQPLVATQRRFTLFAIFMRIADNLHSYEFSNMDSSTFGEIATTSFEKYAEELNFEDVRASTEKAVEMLLLGERMRCIGLYNESFTHVVGKHEESQDLAPSVYKQLSATTQTRLSRASMDLEKRLQNVKALCTDFDMHSVFSGMMRSKTVDERRLVNFDVWKSSCLATRKFVLGYYKARLGSWPPKANPKKNQLKTPGLNRVVLLELYNDLSGMYDLLVDRSDLTNRTADGVLLEERGIDPPRVRALRHILSEWDRASPPVKPPMPFDTPILPNTHTPQADPKMAARKLRTDEVTRLLTSSHNPSVSTPFVQAFQQFERAQAKNCTSDDIADNRYGQWIFMYTILQALPMVVIDVPAIRFYRGVEYFLCQASRGGAPWARDNGSSQQWYGIAGSGGVVSLPSDVVEHSIEGLYRRSHCWEMAERWSAENPIMAAAVQEHQRAATATDSLPPPPEVITDDIAPGFRKRSRAFSNFSGFSIGASSLPPALGSPGLRVDSRSTSPARSKRESVINLGLEAIPLPRGVSPDRRVMTGSTAVSDYIPGPSGRPVSVHVTDPTKTFDAILADVEGQQQQMTAGGKKKK